MVAYNVIGSVSGEDSRLYRSLYRTVLERFTRIWVFPIGISENGRVNQRRNIIILATDADVAQDTLLARIQDRVGGRVKVGGYPDFGLDLYPVAPELSDVPLLTDDHAPIDSLIKVMP